MGVTQQTYRILLINEHRGWFATNLSEVGRTILTEMSIQLADDVPVSYCPYRMVISERQKVRKIVQGHIDCGIVRESCSPYAIPILLVKTKNGEEGYV